jgi:hypothetical protein
MQILGYLPMYELPQHKPGICDKCKKPIPKSYENMGGRGYQSPLPHYYLAVDIDDKTGRGNKGALKSVYDELCRPCYRKVWKKTYPNEKVPV